MENFENLILQRLSCIETKIDNGIIKKQGDHEKRIRFLEKGIYAAFGVLAMLQIILKVVY